MWKWLVVLDRHFEECLAGLALLVMSTLVFAQVVMRYVFHAPMSWSDEIAVYCMVWSVYLSACWAVRERAHIRMLYAIERFPRPVANALMCCSDLLWFGFSGFIFWQGLLLELSLWHNPYASPVLGIDQKWPYLIIAFSSALMMFRLGQIYYRAFVHGEPLFSQGEAARHEEFHS